MASHGFKVVQDFVHPQYYCKGEMISSNVFQEACLDFALRYAATPVFSIGAIGVLFRLVWLKIDGTGLDGFCSIYQGYLFFQKATYDWGALPHVFRGPFQEARVAGRVPRPFRCRPKEAAPCVRCHMAPASQGSHLLKAELWNSMAVTRTGLKTGPFICSHKC